MIVEFDVQIREPYMGNMVPLRVKFTYLPKVGFSMTVVNPEGIVHTGEIISQSESGSTIERLNGREHDG